jgi:hypothetical protein
MTRQVRVRYHYSAIYASVQDGGYIEHTATLADPLIEAKLALAEAYVASCKPTPDYIAAYWELIQAHDVVRALEETP